MDIAVIIAIVFIFGIPLLLLLSFMVWSFFILPRLEEKWARESREEFDELWNKYIIRKR